MISSMVFIASYLMKPLLASSSSVMLPAGHMLFPYVSSVMSGTQFQAIEAVVSATVGFGLSAIVG